MLNRLRQTYQARGLIGVLRLLARRALATLYRRETQHIFVRRIPGHASRPLLSEAAEPGGTTCLFVESAAALREVEGEIPPAIRDSVDQLRKRLAEGCSVVLARRPHASGTGHDVIGYAINEPGVFSALGRRGRVSSDYLFNHYIEVLPEYRGQRIADVMRRAMDEYGRMRGFTRRCSVVSPVNESSRRSNLRYGLIHAGTVARVSILGGLYVWDTPWEDVERALRVGDDDAVAGEQTPPARGRA